MRRGFLNWGFGGLLGGREGVDKAMREGEDGIRGWQCEK